MSSSSGHMDAAAAARRLAAARRRQRVVDASSDEATPAPPPARTPTSALMQESQSVADEAASVLASVRKQRPPARTERVEVPTLGASEASQQPLSPVRPRTTTATALAAAKEAPRSAEVQATIPPKSPLPRPRSPVPAPRSPLPSSVASVASSRPRSPVPSSSVASSTRPRSPLPPPSVSTTTARPKPPPVVVDTNEPSEPLTIEEKEALHHPKRAPPIDASCLPVATKVRLASHRVRCTVMANDDTVPVCGQSMGDAREEWQLELVPMRADAVLRYGDTVAWRATDGRYLGAEEKESQWRVGCFSEELDKKDHWTVLRAVAGSEGRVRVGQTALDHVPSPKRRSTSVTAPVRSGEPVLLRHCVTGGLLTVNDKGELSLLMDSYNEDRNRSGRPDDASLLSRLQQHGTCAPSDGEIFHLTPSVVPSLPLWLSRGAADQRPFLNGTYLLDPQRHDTDPMVDRSLFGSSSRAKLDYTHQASAKLAEQLKTPAGQETVLLDEILGSLVGLEGTHVRVTYQPKQSGIMDALFFHLQDTTGCVFDATLRSLANEILPLATNYIQVRHFVSSHLPGYEYGTVMQALCEELDEFLQEYVTFVCSLEQQCRREASLRRLQVEVRPALNSMATLQRVCTAASSKKGGALLNALRELKLLVCDGDSTSDHLLSRLLDAAAVPYMTQFAKWLACGILDDPYEEFMVKFNKDERYWENKYEVVEQHVLVHFLVSSKASVARILATGRYWNAIQACKGKQSGLSKGLEEPPALAYSSKLSAVFAFVQTMHSKASQILVGLLIDDYQLMSSLRLMKRYFLLDQGDFFVNFMDIAEDELLKEIGSVSRGRIQHWLKTSVQLTEHPSPHGDVAPTRVTDGISPEKLQCRFARESLMDQLDRLHAASGGIDTHEAPTPLRHAYGGMSPDVLTGLGAFHFDFSSIPFPTSLVLSPQVVASYQLLFRHLFFAKHVERRLVSMWQDHQSIKELQSLRGTLGSTFLLRQRMLHFLQNLIYYMMLEVIEPNWAEFEKGIMDPTDCEEQTIDDILSVHMLFLRKTLEACLLTNRDLVRALTKLMSTCLLFSDQMKRFIKATKVEDDRREVANEKRRLVQRNLNDRGGARAALSHKVAREAMQKDLAERNERVKQQTARVTAEASSESYQKMIARFDEVFSDNLCDFMLQLKHSDDLYHTHKVNLAIRLDYNGFVSSALGLSTKSQRLSYDD